MPFEKITVTDIVTRADINRSTFYAHYPDVRGLVEALMDQAVNASMELVSGLNIQDIFMDQIAGLIVSNEDTYRHWTARNRS